MAPRACPGSAIAGWIARGIRIRSRSGRSACAPACPANANRIATCSCRTTDPGDVANFARGDGPVVPYPDFALRAWEAHGCGRLVVAGAELTAIRQRLVVRAAAEALAA